MLNGYGRTSRSTVSLALAPDGSVHVALKRTSTPPPAALACPAPMEQPSAPPDARNRLMAPCIACSNAANWLMGHASGQKTPSRHRSVGGGAITAPQPPAWWQA